MKRAVILHGTNASPESNWFPWLKLKLEAEGYRVWVPALPDNDAPNMQKYNDFLFDSDWDFTDNIVIGHSSGAVAVLNLLMDERCPNIKLGVPVSAWSHGLPTGYVGNAHDSTFPKDGYDFKKIKQKANNLEFIHSNNDPYCPLEQARFLVNSLEARITVLKTNYGGNADHLGSPLTELPELWNILERYL